MEQLKAGGKYFMYHNHAHEFRKIDGQVILGKLAETIPAKIRIQKSEKGSSCKVCL